MNQKFSFRHRLLKKPEFDYVFNFAHHKVRKPPFLLFGVSNQKTHPRLGVVVAKRKIPKAVNRNLIKRLCRERFRVEQESLGCLDLVVLCGALNPKKSKKHLDKQLLESFQQLKQKFTT